MWVNRHRGSSQRLMTSTRKACNWNSLGAGGACSEQRGYPYKRGHLVRLRRSKVTTKDDGEPWYPGDQRDRG
jgi:hypothetical protein